MISAIACCTVLVALPRSLCRGLIEARASSAHSKRMPPLFRGLCAAASLKPRRAVHSEAGDGGLFRGLCAAASLNLRAHADDLPPAGTLFRGLCAAASLKQLGRRREAFAGAPASSAVFVPRPH